MGEMTWVDWSIVAMGVGLLVAFWPTGRGPCRHRWRRHRDPLLRGYYQKCDECGEVREVRRDDR